MIGFVSMTDDRNEELLQQKFMASEPKQADLVKEYCGDIEERIQATRSESEARQIADEACKKFDNACESSVTRSFLRQHVYKLIEQRWNVKL